MVRAVRIGRAAAVLLLAGGWMATAGCRPRESGPPPASASPARVQAVESSDLSARERRPPGGRAPVLWIGLDGLDWELLDRLAGAGRMPNWKRLTSEGASARLRSFYPLLSPILWTTAATGTEPDVHRVLDFQEVDPSSGRKVPISGESRAVPAVWNLASAAGRKVGVVGWWATHPAEEVNGFFVSDRVSPILFLNLSRSGAAFPRSLEQGLEQVAAREGRVESEDLAPYLDMPPAEIERELSSGAGMENPVVALSRVLAATRVTQRIARDLYDRNLPDLTVVYFAGTDEVGHVFAPFTPPRQDCASVSDADVARFWRVVETYYAAIDRILGQWMRRAEEDGAVLLVHSDHGFQWGADRPCGLASGNWATAAFWHQPEGVLAAWGAGVRRGQERSDATLFDVAPTVLALLDLPADARMPGKPLAAAFERLPSRPKSAAGADVAVQRVVPGAKSATSAAESDEYAKKLLALGYLSPGQTQTLAAPGGARPGMTEGAWNNLGMYERETAKDPAAAERAFRQSLKLNPDYYSPMFNLAVLAREKGDTRAAEEWLFRSLHAVKGDPSVAIAGWGREYIHAGKTSAAESLLRRAATVYPDNEPIAREQARLRYRRKDCRGALVAMSRFADSTRDLESVNDLILFQTCLANREEVERLLERSLALKPDQPEARRLLEVVRKAGAGH